VTTNAFDDLPQTSPEMQAVAAAPGVKANAFDDITPTVKDTEQHKPEVSSIASQLERGAGLSARALIQGVTGLPGAVADFGHSLYGIATDPAYRAATWEQAKHPSQWLNADPTSPSQQFSNALPLPHPQTTAEKVMSMGLGAEGGALMPQVPVMGAKAPDNFVTPAQQQTQRLADALRKSQDQGLVVPPSTTNPTMLNKGLETLAGKEATQNEARSINQTARNNLAAGDLGLKPDTMTPEAVSAVKQEAGKVFQQARGIPRFNADEQYFGDLDRILSTNRGANADFPGASNPDVEKVVETYRQPSFTGNSAVSAVQLLRQKASDAYRNGQSELGATYKGISAAIERQTERGALSLEKAPDPQQYSLAMDFADQGDVSSRQLFNKIVPTTHGPQGVNGPMVYDSSSGGWKIQPQTEVKTIQESREFGPSQQTGLPFSTRAPESFGEQPTAAPAGQYSTLVDALRKARKTYAQASTIEDAMDPMGNVSGPKLAAAWNRNEPLSGGLLEAAKHAASYPKANLPANSSNVSHLNALTAPLAAMEGYHLGGIKGAIVGGALPFSRSASRAYLLSDLGQKGAIPATQASKAAALARALARPAVAAGAAQGSQ
jgi:hypothetical protein